MNTEEILKKEREIWGDKTLSLEEIIPRMGKVFGDICKYQRDALKDRAEHTDEELKKELGNMISSTIRWCDDLGFSPDECISLALDCQKNFKK